MNKEFNVVEIGEFNMVDIGSDHDDVESSQRSLDPKFSNTNVYRWVAPRPNQLNLHGVSPDCRHRHRHRHRLIFKKK